MLFKKTLQVSLKNALDSYISKTYEPFGEAFVCEEETIFTAQEAMPPAPPLRAITTSAKRAEGYGAEMPQEARDMAMPTAAMPDLDRELRMLDESFQEMLLRKIDEAGIKDSVCYKRAGVDRKLFSKIRSNPQYKPKKNTAIAFCMALELPYDEASEMLRKAGYALSHSSKADVIVEYFIRSGRYDIGELNLALYEYDQPTI